MPVGLVQAKELLARVASIEPDIRLNMRPPFSPITIVTFHDLLKELAGRLQQIVDLGLSVCPDQQARAEELLESLQDYRLLAEGYYDPEAEKARRKRPLYEVAPDIELISRPAKQFKRDLLSYLQALQACLTEATAASSSF